MKYEYGYISTVRGESKRTVLGSVSENEYEAKKAEISSANFVSSGGLGTEPDKHTRWFIVPRGRK